MKVYLIREKSGIKAVGEFSPSTNELKVKKGSVVSAEIKYTGKFRGAKSVEKSRQGVIENNTVIKDVIFKSPSTAANFVTGNSTNGLIAWKDTKGITIKELLAKGED